MARNAEKEPITVEVDEITLDGKRIVVRNQTLPIEVVRLDPTNPRIAHTLALGSHGGGKSLQQQLANRLWEDPDVHDLLHQVLINRGLIERIIVRSDLSVVEGNCRTVVYRKLQERYPDDPIWRTIPARVLPEDITRRDIAILLGEMHVAGKNTWSPFEKAGHIYTLHKDLALSQDEIATRLRISKSKVNQLVRAFEAMRSKYLPKYPTGAIRKFSYFEELYKNSGLRDWAVDPSNLDMFVIWVGENQITQGNQVRVLPEILNNAAAYKAFVSIGFEAAKRIVEASNPTLTSPLFKTMVELTGLLEQARMDDILRLRQNPEDPTRGITENLTAALAKFRDLCGLSR